MRKALFLSIVSGLLLTAGFPKPELHFLAWIALIPLLFAIRGKTGKQAFFLGYVCGLAHYSTALLWIWHAVYYYGGVNFILALLILILLAAILAPFHALFALIARKWENHPALLVFVLPFVWVALEFGLTYAPFSGFPWTLMAYTQPPVSRLVQFADITGAYGVSWLVAFGNTVIFGLIRGHFRKTGASLLAVGILAAVAYGSWRLDVVKTEQSAVPPFKVSIIQGNIEQSLKWDPSFLDRTLKIYRQLSLDAVKDDPSTDMLFWPESAMPFLYGIDDRYTPFVNDIIRDAGKPVLMGTIGISRAGTSRSLLNQGYLVDENLNFRGSYAKQHLVPFGEYVPFSDLLFFVHKIVPGEMQYVPGKQSGPLYLNGNAMGVLVCYEVIFPQLSRERVLRGAQMLMNLTNDGWYGNTGGPYQHLDISRWRAIEFRVPIVRAANTGISAAFDATGAELGRIEWDKEGFLTFAVRPMRSITLYARFGDIFAWFCIFMTVSALIFSYIQDAGRNRK